MSGTLDLRKLTLHFFLVWPFIWDNTTQRYATAQLFSVPKTYLQAIEIAVIVCLLFYVLLTKPRPLRDSLKPEKPTSGSHRGLQGASGARAGESSS